MKFEDRKLAARHATTKKQQRTAAVNRRKELARIGRAVGIAREDVVFLSDQEVRAGINAYRRHARAHHREEMEKIDRVHDILGEACYRSGEGF